MEKTELLREHQLAPRFRKALRADAKSAIAVPFWGKGAVDLLSIKAGTALRIVCNVTHPGCNPDAIDELRNLKIRVKTNPKCTQRSTSPRRWLLSDLRTLQATV